MADNKKEFTILITDDDKINLDILGYFLSPLYNLLVSRSGARALEIAEANRPDLILLDILMPAMTGYEVITKLKESEVTNKIPVIFITGLTGVEDEEKGFLLGAVDYITKPFIKAIVLARVNTHIKIIDHMRTIERVGLIDPLTKISNRRAFEERLKLEWGRASRDKSPISILLIDIDKFKDYNDTYGHQQGDAALKTFAEISVKSLMRSADFAARWGGEEFAILLPGIGANGAAEVAERVRKNIETAVIPTEEKTDTRITISIGVNSIVPGSNDSSGNFIKKADQALYKAKELGRNRFVISEV